MTLKREETVDYNIKACWHAIYRMYNHQANEYGITTSMGFVLLNIDSKEGTRATSIAPLMGLEARSLTRMLKSMEEKGLLHKERDPEDGRSVRVFLTKEGIAKKEIAKRTVKTFNNKVREVVPDKKLQIFFDVINRINKIIEEDKIYRQLEIAENNEA